MTIDRRRVSVLPAEDGADHARTATGPACKMSQESNVWLAARRDHDGNLDVLRMPGGARFAWDLTEAEADAVIAWVQSTHRKAHGQSYWKLSYPKGTLSTFLKANTICA